MGKIGRSEWIKLDGSILIEGKLKVDGRALKWTAKKTKSGLFAKVDGPSSEIGRVFTYISRSTDQFFDKNEGSSKNVRVKVDKIVTLWV